MDNLDFTGDVRDPLSWGLDTSTGTPILVYKNCSVIEASDAEYIMKLIEADTRPKSLPFISDDQKYDIITNHFSENWAIGNAFNLLHDYHVEPTNRLNKQVENE